MKVFNSFLATRVLFVSWMIVAATAFTCPSRRWNRSGSCGSTTCTATCKPSSSSIAIATNSPPPYESRSSRLQAILEESFGILGNLFRRIGLGFRRQNDRFTPRPPSTPPPLSVLLKNRQEIGQQSAYPPMMTVPQMIMTPHPPSTPPPLSYVFAYKEQTIGQRLRRKLPFLGLKTRRQGCTPPLPMSSNENPNDDKNKGNKDDDDDKFSFAQRIESTKAAVVGAVSGGIGVTPFAFLHNTVFNDGSSAGLAQWEFDTDMGSLEAALFALVYRYAVREDVNPQLQQGVIGAFVLVRTLSRIDVSPTCSAIPLRCGEPLGYFDYSMLSQAAINGVESAALFGVAALAMDYCFDRNIISKFK